MVVRGRSRFNDQFAGAVRVISQVARVWCVGNGRELRTLRAARTYLLYPTHAQKHQHAEGAARGVLVTACTSWVRGPLLLGLGLNPVGGWLDFYCVHLVRRFVREQRPDRQFTQRHITPAPPSTTTGGHSVTVVIATVSRSWVGYTGRPRSGSSHQNLDRVAS